MTRVISIFRWKALTGPDLLWAALTSLLTRFGGRNIVSGIEITSVMRRQCISNSSKKSEQRNHGSETSRGRRLLRGIWMLPSALFIAALLFEARIVAADEPVTGLHDGWKWRTIIPPLKHNDNVIIRESRVMFWVEEGWLVVRRSTIDGDVEWQVVLAQASDPTRPRIKVNDVTRGFEVRYREYFIREGIAERLRIYRELKTSDSPQWPILSLDGVRTPHGSGSCATSTMSSFSLEQWCWLTCGLSEKRPDLWVRLQPTTNRRGEASRGNAISGFSGTADGPGEMFYGDSQAQDEGDLFVGTRTIIDKAERGLDGFMLDRALGAKTTPALSGDAWLNGADALSLDNLKGRVVLLYFWADSCKDSVNKLARIEQLYRKFKDRDFLVVGIHSAEQRDSTSEPVMDHTITFPVMIDDGRTAKGYHVDALPSCFLIDANGKVVWGFGMAPPSDARIEDLLK